MPRRKVSFSTGDIYHIYNRAVTDNLLFRELENYHFFLRKVREYILPLGEILAYCLMPNHYHLLFKLNKEGLSIGMQRLALSYTVSFNNHYQRSGHLFQGRFCAKHVKDTQYLVHLTRYIHLNPQAAKLVRKAENWEFSSLQEYVGLRQSSIVNIIPVLEIISDTKKGALADKYKKYREFIDEWDSEYMKFKPK